ncbi:MAG: glycosyltransferase family 2 protein [Firmicutes bacterium]|nr:glycosyltransferase family 2 protein [Bacillota bacterium]
MVSVSNGQNGFSHQHSSAANPGTDIVIVSYNSLRHLQRCLQALYRYTPRPFKIYIVDNASTDGTVSFLQGRADVECIFNTVNKGFAAACNQGIRRGHHDYIVLLNPDVEVTKGWLEPLIRVARNPKVAVVGPKMVNPAGLIVGAGVQSWEEITRPRGWLQPDRPGLYDRLEECISVGGACYLLKRALLAELGLLDERYFLYFEETDYSISALKAGYKVIYNPESKVIHHVAGSGAGEDFNRRMMHFQESQRQFVRKWRGKIPCLP